MSTLPKHSSMFRFMFLALPMLVSSTAHSQATAENQYVQAPIILVQLGPGRQETLPPPENERCANYARGAVADYAAMRRVKKCFIPDSPRWQPHYRNHYQWCLTARPEWLTSEAKARNAHLLRCGGRSSY